MTELDNLVSELEISLEQPMKVLGMIGEASSGRRLTKSQFDRIVEALHPVAELSAFILARDLANDQITDMIARSRANIVAEGPLKGKS